MDSQKIGSFLRALRKERGLTQEQLAEALTVSSRTVSRWETGSNMPDIATLVALAEFFEVTIPELIDGERKDATMNEEVKTTSLKLADYAEAEKALLTRRLCIISVVGLVALLLGLIQYQVGLVTTPLLSCLNGICFGLALGALLTSILYATGTLASLRRRIKGRRAAWILFLLCWGVLLLRLLTAAYHSL